LSTPDWVVDHEINWERFPSSWCTPGADPVRAARAENGFLMPAFEDKYGWLPIDSAPFNEDVRLTVSDGRGGDPYRLPYPCRRTTAGWVSSKTGSLQTVTPLKWQPYYEPRKWKRNP
jgi:hypothetical protein